MITLPIVEPEVMSESWLEQQAGLNSFRAEVSNNNWISRGARNVAMHGLVKVTLPCGSSPNYNEILSGIKCIFEQEWGDIRKYEVLLIRAIDVEKLKAKLEELNLPFVYDNNPKSHDV